MFITDVNDSGMFDVKVYEILVINLKCILDKYDFLNNKKKKTQKLEQSCSNQITNSINRNFRLVQKIFLIQLNRIHVCSCV